MSKEIYAIKCDPHGALDDGKMKLTVVTLSVGSNKVRHLKSIETIVDKWFISGLIDHLQEALDKMKPEEGGKDG